MEFMNISLCVTSLGYQKGTDQLLCEFWQIWEENEHGIEEFPFSCIFMVHPESTNAPLSFVGFCSP